MSVEQARNILCQCIAERGISVYEDKQFQALLRDYFRGEHKRELNILILAHQAQVPAELEASSHLVPIDIHISRLTTRLISHHGTQEDLARWAVDSWAVALDKLPQASRSPATQVAITQNPKLVIETDTRDCPFCAESIKAAAIKCRFCGEFFNQPDDTHSNPQSHSLVSALPKTTEINPFAPRIINSLGMEFVLIQPGTFFMGSPAGEKDRNDDETQHWVTLTKAYYLQTTPVTQGQWEAVMGDNPSQFKGDIDLPVENVSWEDCQEYLQKVNRRHDGTYRLPSEAEWEYACRAGTVGPFGIGDGKNLDASQANFKGDCPYGKGKEGELRKCTTPVGIFQPNTWGLYDMHGNVYEWCHDWYSNYSPVHQTDPIGPNHSEGHVVRGGGWANYGAHVSRSACRYWLYPELCGNDLGFRLVRCVK